MVMISSPFDFDLARKMRRAKGLGSASPVRIAGELLLFTADRASERNEAIKAYNIAAEDKAPTPGGPAGMGYEIPTGSISVGTRTI